MTKIEVWCCPDRHLQPGGSAAGDGDRGDPAALPDEGAAALSCGCARLPAGRDGPHTGVLRQRPREAPLCRTRLCSSDSLVSPPVALATGHACHHSVALNDSQYVCHLLPEACQRIFANAVSAAFSCYCVVAKTLQHAGA